jgi:hypothetical protein
MKEYGIKLGSILFTMVEPRPGHAVEYNRWYERDHFYAGCMIGAWTFAGQRWVATAELKAMRYPRDASPVTPDPAIGSYLALYWILDGHHDEWNRWAVDQVNWLHANGRMFAERDHIHTLLYDFEWGWQRDPEGVSPELALDHRYPGLAVVVGELADGSERADLERWYRLEHLPTAAAAIDQCLMFEPQPLLADAPSDVPRSGDVGRRFLQLYFLNAPPGASWAHFSGHPDALAASGLGRVLWMSPFLPTIPGTDTYTDEV